MRNTAREWFCYDSAAEVYDSVSVPLMFRKPAIDLVRLLKPERQHRMLDVGAGTGAISKAAQRKVASVIAVDLSAGMLRQTGLSHLIAARVPGLPFPSNSFDLITAGFLLTHIPDYSAALVDMMRVLVSSGKIGLAFWKMNQNRYSETWLEIAQEFAGKNFFADVVGHVLPWEDWFSERAHVSEALSSAGFVAIDLVEKIYQCSANIDEYVASKHIGLQARFLKQQWDERTWFRFVSTVQKSFRKRFREPLEFSTDVIFGIGKKVSV